MSPKLYTPAELAEQLGLPTKTLAQWRYTGTGPSYVKVGKHVRYRPVDVDAWLDSRAVATGGAAA